MKIFGYWTLFIALCISVVAAWYSIIGLTAIFAAAFIPIVIMGSALEVAKVTTAIWLHRYWDIAPFLMKFYLTIATIVLMFITSMGIFGFLSKAHIEQTSAANEGIAQIERIETDIARYEAIITRSEERIVKAEASTGERNTDIQAQIDKEQTRIDGAYDRIQPAIDEQQAIIDAEAKLIEDRVAVFTESIASLDTELTRLNGLVEEYRTQLKNTSVASVEAQVKPYLDQITQLDADIARLDEQAADYEKRIAGLKPDYSAVDTLQEQINAVEDQIVLVTNKLQSKEREKIQEGQAVIGVTSDGLFGSNTTRAYNTWLEAQRTRITELQGQETTLKAQAQEVVAIERNRLTELVKDLRGSQTTAVQERKQGLLNTIDTIRNNAAGDLKGTQNSIQEKIDGVLNNDIPTNRADRKLAQDAITTLRNTNSDKVTVARAEIARLRDVVNAQIVQSNTLISDLRNNLTVGKDTDADSVIDQQQNKIREANNTIDTLTEKKYSLEAENRKLEAEVGPVKYIAEMVYGEAADRSILEEAVRWVILLLVAVFDPLAIVLVLAGVMTIHKFGRSERPPIKKTDPEVEPELEVLQEEVKQEPDLKFIKEQKDESVDGPTDSNIQNDDVEHNERDRKANDEEDLSRRSIVEPAEKQVPDSTQVRKEPSAVQDTGGSTKEVQIKPAVARGEVKTIKNVTLKKRIKKDDPDNSWLNDT